MRLKARLCNNQNWQEIEMNKTKEHGVNACNTWQMDVSLQGESCTYRQQKNTPRFITIPRPFTLWSLQLQTGFYIHNVYIYTIYIYTIDYIYILYIYIHYIYIYTIYIYTHILWIMYIYMGHGQYLVYGSKSSLFEECIIVFQVLAYK